MTARAPAVAGRFYPADPSELAAFVDGALRAVPAGAAPGPKALVAPHAGYAYSGPIAAIAYATLLPRAAAISRVVLLGPAHRVAVEGLAYPTVDAFRTPLGDVEIDADARARVASMPGVVLDDRPHADEHSIEVHLPFLQRVLGEFVLAPMVVGRADTELVASVLDALWGGDETVVVVSTDLSHYEDYASAAQHDARTAAAVVAGTGSAVGPYDACGAYPLRGLLAAAHDHALSTRLLDLRSSGDTAGPRDRVVGYGAFALATDRGPDA